MDIAQLHKHFLDSSGISTDTRKIKENQLFLALSGENFNGNTFAAKALEAGAHLAIIDDEKFEIENRTILVKNCLETLQKLATYHRNYIKVPIIALTGSNGKTTTKELINAVLSQKFKTVATNGNLNNHIGVPLTLLSMTKETEIGIVEMGANHLKEIENLCRIALPDYGYITNFGKAHLEGFGSEEGVIQGKSELYRHILKHNGLLFINGNDAKQVQLSEKAKIYSFGTSSKADVQISFPPARLFAQIVYKNHEIQSQLTGQYNATNMAAALSIGLFFKISEEAIKSAIAGYVPSNNRSQMIYKNNLTILLDAYNANPTSMEAALTNFTGLEATNKIAILGDMFELGSATQKEHKNLLKIASNQHYDTVIAVGVHFKAAALEEENFFYFKNVEDFTENLPGKLKTQFKKPVSILIKGSRGMALERLVPFLEEHI